MKNPKNIEAEIHGRLGNQLFQYAFARAIQEKTGGTLHLNFYYVHLQAQKQAKEHGWQDSLLEFQTHYSSDSLPPVKNIKQKLTLSQRTLYFLDRLLSQTSMWRRLHYQSYKELTAFPRFFAQRCVKHSLYIFPNNASPYVDGNNKTIYLKAFFEDEQLFASVRPKLLAEYEPRIPLLPQNKDIFMAIKNTNSVCVTIRRGDYVGMKQLFQCDEDYFLRGIAIIREKIAQPVFFFFSDDLSYAANFAKQAMKAGEHYYVETPGNPLAEKLRLMKACKHFIISNSTFSWWAQYLGEAPNKIVIGPKQWMPNAPENRAPVQKSWIRL